MTDSPAVERFAWTCGYLAGSDLQMDERQALAVIAHLVPRSPFARGYVAGLVACQFGISLWPVPDATRVRPWSTVSHPFTSKE